MLRFGYRGRLAVSLLGFLFLSAGEPDAILNPQEYPAHDSHEGVTIAVRPVPDQGEAEKIFGDASAPVRAGFLPVQLVILNRRDDTIRVDLDRILLVTEDGKFRQAEVDRIVSALYPPKDIDAGPAPSPLPFPFPLPKGDNDRKEAKETLRARQLRTDLIQPGQRVQGYRYFDLRGAAVYFPKTKIYIPDVKTVPGEKPLLYFEISLAPFA